MTANRQRLAISLFLMAAFVSAAAVGAVPQFEQQTEEGVLNGSFESWIEGRPQSWIFGTASGSEVRQDNSAPVHGEFAALIDALQDSVARDSFSNLMQVIPAEPWRGKKVRLRASVKTGQLEGSARVQMWLRVDLKPDSNQAPDAPSPVGAFDNMDNRPIRSETWEHFDIVLPITEDADKMALGVFLIGRGQAWIDDVTLEVVDDDTPDTTQQNTVRAPQFQLHPLVMKALQEADRAPRQPFFTHWLWLPLVALLLFFIAMLGPLPPDRKLVNQVAAAPTQSTLSTFSIRVAATYWLLYCLPSMTAALARDPWGMVAKVRGWIETINSALAHGIAANLFGIKEELIPPNGSGDTTYNYMLVLGWFMVSLVIGLIWTAVDRRATDNSFVRDLLRSWLRYAIAFSMIGYGLAKFCFEGNQFPPNSPYQLDKTWGDSSPMNALWAFMGASQAYTMFAGIGEIVAGLLIVWRRTCLLGAFVALGVMTNVMMMNFCYDVPVKLYSSHLVVMSMMVILPDARRLFDLFVLNRPVAPAVLVGIWQSRWAWWTRLILKTLIVGGLILWPVGIRCAHLPSQWRSYVESTQNDVTENYRLTTRGFRWINEVPFNR